MLVLSFPSLALVYTSLFSFLYCELSLCALFLYKFDVLKLR